MSLYNLAQGGASTFRNEFLDGDGGCLLKLVSLWEGKSKTGADTYKATVRVVGKTAGVTTPFNTDRTVLFVVNPSNKMNAQDAFRFQRLVLAFCGVTIDTDNPFDHCKALGINVEGFDVSDEEDQARARKLARAKIETLVQGAFAKEGKALAGSVCYAVLRTAVRESDGKRFCSVFAEGIPAEQASAFVEAVVAEDGMVLDPNFETPSV